MSLGLFDRGWIINSRLHPHCCSSRRPLVSQQLGLDNIYLSVAWRRHTGRGARCEPGRGEPDSGGASEHSHASSARRGCWLSLTYQAALGLLHNVAALLLPTKCKFYWLLIGHSFSKWSLNFIFAGNSNLLLESEVLDHIAPSWIKIVNFDHCTL